MAIDLELAPFTLTLAVPTRPLSALINPAATSRPSGITPRGATVTDLSYDSALAPVALLLRCSKSGTSRSCFCTEAAAARALF